MYTTLSSPACTPLLVLNCGSSSINYAVFDTAVSPLPRRPEWQDQTEAIDNAQAYHDALLRIREAPPANWRDARSWRWYTASCMVDTATRHPHG